MDIVEKREKVGYYLSLINEAKQRITRFQSNNDDLDRIKKINFALDKIGELTDGLSQEELQEVLGGEFCKEYLNGQPFDTGRMEIPAYFLLDVASGVLSKQCSDISVLSGPTQEVLARMKKLRDIASELDFDPLFDPKKEIPKAFIDELSKRAHSYYLGVKKSHDIRYIEMTIHSVSENLEYKNGEYHSLGVTHNSGSMPLYEEDAKALEAKKEEEIQERLRNLDILAKKYFRDGVIPNEDDFEDCLLDESLDPRIVGALKEISRVKGHDRDERDLVQSIVGYKYIQRVPYVEESVAKEQEEAALQSRKEEEVNTAKKEAEIDKARQRYQEKSSLWRVFHKKQDINKMDFSQMSTEEISRLYNNGKKGTK